MATNGFGGSISFTDTTVGGSDGTVLQWSLSTNVDALEDTSFDTAGDSRTFERGLASHTIDFNSLWDASAKAQIVAMQDVGGAGGTITVLATTGSVGYEAPNCFITNINIVTEARAQIVISATAIVSGDITELNFT